MFRRALVATDFTQGAKAALDRAIRLPLSEDARIDVVHVLPEREDPSAAFSERLERELDRARAATRGSVSFVAHFPSGRPFVEIIRAARIHDAELIVVGAHGARPFRDRLLGSTASSVIRSGDIPVLVVRTAATAPYRNVLVALSLSDVDRRLVQLASQVGASRPAVVHAVHVPFERWQATTAAARAELRERYCGEASAKLRRLLADLEPGAPWSITVDTGESRAILLEEAARRGSDLLVAGTHARSGIQHALLGSVAETLIAAAPCDVLVARPTRCTFELP